LAAAKNGVAMMNAKPRAVLKFRTRIERWLGRIVDLLI
jgi:hypothetical protein